MDRFSAVIGMLMRKLIIFSGSAPALANGTGNQPEARTGWTLWFHGGGPGAFEPESYVLVWRCFGGF